MSLRLHNPHSVLTALRHRPGSVIEVRLGLNRPTGAWEDVAKEAVRQRIPVSTAEPDRDSRRRQKRGPSDDAGRTAVAEALVREREETPLEELFRNEQKPSESGQSEQTSSGPAQTPVAAGYGLWLALDLLQDPHNVGAIFRTAAFFGIRGIVLSRDRSAPMTATVYDVASGGVEHVPYCQPVNLSRALEAAKEAGLWILGSSEHSEKELSAVPRDRPWLLVLGNEERGLRQLTLKTCDEVCRLSPRGPVGSLNVSVAAAVMMAELTRGAE